MVQTLRREDRLPASRKLLQAPRRPFQALSWISITSVSMRGGRELFHLWWVPAHHVRDPAEMVPPPGADLLHWDWQAVVSRQPNQHIEGPLRRADPTPSRP